MIKLNKSIILIKDSTKVIKNFTLIKKQSNDALQDIFNIFNNKIRGLQYNQNKNIVEKMDIM